MPRKAFAALLGGSVLWACGTSDDGELFGNGGRAPGPPSSSGGAQTGGTAGQAASGAGGEAGSGGVAGGAGGVSGGAGGAAGASGGAAGADAGGAPADGGAPVCQAGAPLCAGDVATVCASDGSGPEPGGTNCTATDATCAAGACVPNCPAGSRGCACLSAQTCTGALICVGGTCRRGAPPPVAHWEFEDDALDSSGNGHHGTEQDVGYTNGVDGRAAQFDPQNDSYIEANAFADDFLAISSSFTVFIRVRPDQHASGTVNLFGVGAPGESVATNEFRFIFEGGVVLETETGASGTNHLARLGDLPPEGEWIDLVFVVDGSTVRYYANGSLVSTTTFTPAETTATSLVIGGWQDGKALDGAIDDVRVFDVVLTAAQIAAL